MEKELQVLLPLAVIFHREEQRFLFKNKLEVSLGGVFG